MGRSGGVYIDLEAEQRKEREREEAKAREAEEKLAKETKALAARRREDVLWAYNMYVLGVGPAVLAFVTVLVGPFVHKAGERCRARPLTPFVRMFIALAYIYLFVYTWMLMGPLPFRGRTKPLRVFFAIYAFVAFVTYVAGTAVLVTGPACQDQAPMQYGFFKFQIAIFVLGGLCAGGKLALEKYDRKVLLWRKEKRAKMKEALKGEMERADDEDDDDDDDDDGDDGDDGDEGEEEGEGDGGGGEEEEEDDDDEEDNGDGGEEGDGDEEGGEAKAGSGGGGSKVEEGEGEKGKEKNKDAKAS